MDYELIETPQGLTLTDGEHELRADFTRMIPRLQQGKLQRELLVRAAKLKGCTNPTALDATAGLGEDSLLLAAAGFTVTLFERDSIIAALLRDALRRAAMLSELTESVSRMRLIEGDSIEGMHRLQTTPAIILLDPMFPARQKSAAVKKKLQMLQGLEQPCEDEAALLDAAHGLHPRKIIIKRPSKGPYLAGAKPSYSLEGKAVRYDVIVG